jgi:hypothetical protein
MQDALKLPVIRQGFLQEDASAILGKRRNASFHILPASLFTFLPSKATGRGLFRVQAIQFKSIVVYLFIVWCEQAALTTGLNEYS